MPWGAGGGADVLGRILAKWLEADLKTPFPVLNLPGASGMIGLGKMITGAADGYTVAILTGDSLMMAATPTASFKFNDSIALGVLVRQPSGIFAPTNSPYKTWRTSSRRRSPKRVPFPWRSPGPTRRRPDGSIRGAKKVSLLGVPIRNRAERYTGVRGARGSPLRAGRRCAGFLDAGQLRPLLFL